jgi:protein-disulfide isomerase/uncharacterized membrane protein
MSDSFFLDTLSERLGTYRPVANRIMLGLAGLGLLVVTHLLVQQQQGFANGCLGVTSAAAFESAFDCQAVVQSGAGSLLGLSNVVWGYGFYGALVLLSVGMLMLPALRRYVHGARLGLLGGGLAYSAYLSYVQVAVLDALCALCLTSAGLVAVLTALQVYTLVFPSRSTEPMSARFKKREFALLAYLSALVVILAGADLVYFTPDAPTHAETPVAPAATPDTHASSAPSEASPASAACRLDAERGPVPNWESLINMQDPITGDPAAPVTLIEYFDPNCPHCADFHAVAKAVEAEHEGVVRVVYKPFALRASSIPEIQALYAAAQEGKFLEMLEAQFERQQGTVTTREVETIASDIGMNAETLMTRIESNRYRPYILEQRQKAIDLGVSSTPTVLINGHFVQTRSADCLTQFIEQAQAGTLSASAG